MGSGRHPGGPARHAGDGVDRMSEQVAVVDARPAAETPHRVTHLQVDERVHEDGRAAAGARHGQLEVGDALDARVPDLLELLVGELCLERLHEPVGGLAGGVGDDVKLDGGMFRHGGIVAVSVRAMATDVVTMDKIVSLARRRGFVFPSSEIYGGLGSAYDYGHYGVLAKNNVKARWLEAMVQERDDIVALDSAIILNPRIWEASGHVEGFSDPLVDCRTCKLRFRADKLEDGQCGRKPSKKPGETDECDLTEPRAFHLMFETRVGAVEDSSSKAYLRPETAQGIFVNFKNVLQLARRKPPFGIAQIGKSFRNEITPGNFLFRTREFEQMEMEYFVPPADADEWYGYWIDQRYGWYTRYGLRESHLRVRPHEADELSHYSSATSDVEYLFPIGWSELEGIANRGAFDLTQHTEHSGTKLEYVGQDGERYVPYVIEPAGGVDRTLLAFLVDSYDEEEVAGRQRTVLRLHPRIAPVKAAVLPLIGKDSSMVERARGLHEDLRRQEIVEYDDNGAIGRRYRRQDEIGTPWAFTIDEQTLEDDTVTVRDRDSLAQERLPIPGVRAWLADALARDWKTPKSG
jgi:glycyl-tRNA synthetase